MHNLSFLHSLEVAQKFVVEEPEIMLRSQRLYGDMVLKGTLVISLSLSQAEQ